MAKFPQQFEDIAAAFGRHTIQLMLLYSVKPLFAFLAKSLYVVFGCTLSTNKMILHYTLYYIARKHRKVNLSNMRGRETG